MVTSIGLAIALSLLTGSIAAAIAFSTLNTEEVGEGPQRLILSLRGTSGDSKRGDDLR